MDHISKYRDNRKPDNPKPPYRLLGSDLEFWITRSVVGCGGNRWRKGGGPVFPCFTAPEQFIIQVL